MANKNNRMKLTGNDLRNIGFPETKAIGIALTILEREFSDRTIDENLELLKEVIKQPSAFENNPTFLPLVHELLKPVDSTIALKEETQSYQIYGAEAIEQGALKQMETAMKLPVT